MQKRKQEIIDEFAQSEGAVRGWSILSFSLKAKFINRNSVQLDDGTIIRADNFVISTGSKISIPQYRVLLHLKRAIRFGI